MKKTHIIGILLIALTIGSMFALLGNSSTYSDFANAMKADDEVHVAGTLDRSKKMVYDPASDPNKFSFYMIDRKGNERHVILLKSKPQDFERSQQVVIIGSMKGDDFIAKDVLMKCPSKYNSGVEIPVK
ncbi:MAG: cytochrome c maturation protein CcmE [Bacteroidetes bacterium]|nr:cytochrome c maturation protein CcmE [Bacteroidota bacterium]